MALEKMARGLSGVVLWFPYSGAASHALTCSDPESGLRAVVDRPLGGHWCWSITDRSGWVVEQGVDYADSGRAQRYALKRLEKLADEAVDE